MRRATVALPLVSVFALLTACAPKDAPIAESADISCFGSRVLSFQDLGAEVVIPDGEDCTRGTFQVVFTRNADTLGTLSEERDGSVGFIGTADVNGDGRGEFFVSTLGATPERRGALFAFTEDSSGVARLDLAPLTAEQLTGYAGQDRFGFGGGDQLVRAFPRASGDTAWFAYSHGEQRWNTIERPSWIQ